MKVKTFSSYAHLEYRLEINQEIAKPEVGLALYIV